MTGFDYAAGLLLIVSALVGLARGATREVTTVAAFVMAAVLAVFSLRFTGALARHVIHIQWLSTAAAILTVFVASYIVLRLIGGLATQGVRQTALSGLDRLLGLGVGVVRALVVLGGFTLLFKAATPPERMPAWMSDAKLFPLASAAGDALRAFAPRGLRMAHDVAPALAEAVSDPAPARSRPARGRSRRNDDDGTERRQALDDQTEDSR